MFEKGLLGIWDGRNVNVWRIMASFNSINSYYSFLQFLFLFLFFFFLFDVHIVLLYR